MPILSVLACFALLPGAQGQLSPPPDGCYFNFTTAEGCDALNSLTSGAGNTALGWRSLFLTTDGSFNTAVGGGALIFNNGSSNTAVGAAALLLNSTGSNNTAVGTDALVNNTANDNTAVGFFALQSNTTGGTLETILGTVDLGPNTAIGSHALESNVDGSANTAVGYNALHNQMSGDVFDGLPEFAANTAVGFEALANVTGSATGQNIANTAYGYQSLFDLTDGFSNVAVGFQAGGGLTTGYGNIFLGTFAGSGLASESFHTYIGNIAFTSQPVVGSVDFVTVDLSGLLGHSTSSRRYKEDINPMDKASEALYQLNPVTYRYKKEIDKTQSLAFGLIAEEVAEVNPDLVVHNAQGQPENVHYEMVNAMLLNEFLKEHRTVRDQQRELNALKTELRKQAVLIQKVSDKVELNKPVPQMVADGR